MVELEAKASLKALNPASVMSKRSVLACIINPHNHHQSTQPSSINTIIINQHNQHQSTQSASIHTIITNQHDHHQSTQASPINTISINHRHTSQKPDTDPPPTSMHHSYPPPYTHIHTDETYIHTDQTHSHSLLALIPNTQHNTQTCAISRTLGSKPSALPWDPAQPSPQ